MNKKLTTDTNHTRTRLRLFCAAGLFLFTFSSGCMPDMDSGFESPNPEARLRAITKASREKDDSPKTLRELVKSLSNDDPVERMLAIDALKHITGQTLDYRYYDSLVNRERAINRWLTWLYKNGITETPPTLYKVDMPENAETVKDEIPAGSSDG